MKAQEGAQGTVELRTCVAFVTGSHICGSAIRLNSATIEAKKSTTVLFYEKTDHSNANCRICCGAG
jgi:hypothetical protein